MATWIRTATAALVVGLTIGPAPQAAVAPAEVSSSPSAEDTSSAVASVSVSRAESVPGSVVQAAPWSTPIHSAWHTAWNTGFYTATLVHDDTAYVSYFSDGTGSVDLASCRLPCTEAQVHRISNVPGIGTDLVRFGDGLAVSYLDLGSRTVQLATCASLDCTSVDVSPVAAADSVGVTRMTVTADGALVLAYPALGGGVALSWCRDRHCRSGDQLELEGPSSGDGLALAASPDGGVLLVHRNDDRHLQLSRCTRQVCREIAATPGPGTFPSLATGSDGAVAMSYHHLPSHSLHVVTCQPQASCREVAIDPELDAGYFSDIALSTSGLPRIAHRAESPASLMVVACQTTDCATVTHTVVSRHGTPGEHLSLALDADDVPVIAHHDSTSTTLQLTRCAGPECATRISGAHYGGGVSLALTPDGQALVAYRDNTTMDLRTGTCTVGLCPDVAPVDSSGDVGLDADLTLADAGNLTVVHRDARSHRLRLVSCAQPCVEPQLVTLPTPHAVAKVTTVVGSDGERRFVATSPDGAVSLGRCADGCSQIDWQPLTTSYPGLDSSVAVVGNTTVVATLAAEGVVLHRCAEDCATTTLDEPDVAQVELAAVDGALVAVLRRLEGTTTIHHCDTLSCSNASVETLDGHHELLAVAVAGPRVLVATGSRTGGLSLLDCADGCVETAQLDSPEGAWSLDVATSGNLVAVSTLSPQGVWVGQCDGDRCATDSLDTGATEAPVGSHMSHQ